MLSRKKFPLFLFLLLFLGTVVVPVLPTESASSPGRTVAPLILSGSGANTSFFYVLDVPYAQDLTYDTKIYQEVGTGTHHKAFGLIIHESYLDQETDVFPVDEDGYWVLPPGQMYMHEVWNGPQNFAHMEIAGRGESRSFFSQSGWMPIVFPSPYRGEVSTEPGRYFLVVAGTDDFHYTINLTGEFSVEGPYTLGSPSRSALTEGSFTSTFSVGVRARYIPVAAAVLQAEVDIRVAEQSFLLFQVLTEGSEAEFRLLRPSGVEVPLHKKWNSGSFAGPLLLTRGGLYQTDLIVMEQGTWSLQAEYAVGSAFDAVAASIPLGGLTEYRTG